MSHLTTAQQEELNEFLQSNSLLGLINKYLQENEKGHFEVVAIKIQPKDAPAHKDVLAEFKLKNFAIDERTGCKKCPSGYIAVEGINANGDVTCDCVRVG